MTDKPTVIMSGLPGKMATLVAETILKEAYIGLADEAFTGFNQPEYCEITGRRFKLVSPEDHEEYFKVTRHPMSKTMVVDFTQPDVVNRNAELYCRHNIPFVMGTTGGDRAALEKVVVDSGNIAVIAPNMAKPIVAFQAMMEYAARNFPNLFGGFGLDIVESHQAGKKDTSGTAKAIVGYFNRLGIPFSPEQIKMIRNPDEQRELGVPEEYLNGHGWHTYTLQSPDYTVTLEFTHNINGRRVYADGTIDAIKFLHKKVLHPEYGSNRSKGKVYSMIDVLKADRR